MSEGTVSIEQVKDFIKQMSLMDAAKLVKDLEEELGVSAAAPVAMVAAGGAVAGGAAAGPAAEAQTEFTVMLMEKGATAINVIKEVRAITGLGLKEAKDLVDAAPSDIKTGVAKAEADELKAKFEEAGAKVTLK